MLVLRPDGHLVSSAAAYVNVPNKRSSLSLPSAGPKLGSQPLLFDALESLQEKIAGSSGALKQALNLA